ncbi:MAG: hypothetical protein AB2L09_12695 [Coriobacteriia bacterium]
MNSAHTARTGRFAKIALAAAFVLIFAAAIVGCGDKSDSSEGKDTALGTLSVAQSSLSTMAPDAKLLVVQTANVASTTSTPVWAYLFGSPETDATYIVFVQEGEATPYEYGQASLTATQWADVPDTDEIKIDSDKAHDLAAAKLSEADRDAPWVMGLVTYLPSTQESGVTQMSWSVTFNPEAMDESDIKAYEVDARTGKVTEGQ